MNTNIESTNQIDASRSFEPPAITRALYMDGGISHQDYYAHIAKLAGIKPSLKLIERARVALTQGDKHLNTIPLHEWDQLASGSHLAVQRAVKQIPGETNSLSTGVCAWKATVRAQVTA
jgi:hypothetical protein